MIFVPMEYLANKYEDYSTGGEHCLILSVKPRVIMYRDEVIRYS